MNFHDFKEALQNLPVFNGREAVKLGERQTMYNQLNNWRRRGLVVQLRRGLYIFGKSDRKTEPGKMFLAGRIYEPSYISVEYALSMYGLIPEGVTEFTSVTAKNTASFETELGNFSYRHIKREAFRGFKTGKDRDGLTYFIAEPEKAVVDFIYLNLPRFKRGDRDVFARSYRFQNLEILDFKKLLIYARLFDNVKLNDIAGEFRRFAGEELKS